MSRVKHLDRSDIGRSAVYLFEGGMVNQHRTKHSEQLTHKIRLGCLFGSHILMHAGNLFEEASMFNAVKTDEDLFAQGKIVPILSVHTGNLETYGDIWVKRFTNRDSTEPAFYQARPITRKTVADIEKRIQYFQDREYHSLKLQPANKTKFLETFLVNLEQILADEPELNAEIKREITERACAKSSPLGRIRHEVLRRYWTDTRLAGPVRRVARRINVAYFGSSASELGTWFSMNSSAFEDLRRTPTRRRTVVSELVEFSVSRTLEITPDRLIAIRPDDFASIVSSAEAAMFRRQVERIVDRISKDFETGIDPDDIRAARHAGQHEIDESFRDTFTASFDRAIRRRRRIESRRVRFGIGGGLLGLGVATDLLTGTLSTPIPIGTAIGATLSTFAGAKVQPRIAPVIMLQDRLRTAADRSDLQD